MLILSPCNQLFQLAFFLSHFSGIKFNVFLCSSILVLKRHSYIVRSIAIHMDTHIWRVCECVQDVFVLGDGVGSHCQEREEDQE